MRVLGLDGVERIENFILHSVSLRALWSKKIVKRYNAALPRSAVEWFRPAMAKDDFASSWQTRNSICFADRDSTTGTLRHGCRSGKTWISEIRERTWHGFLTAERFFCCLAREKRENMTFGVQMDLKSKSWLRHHIGLWFATALIICNSQFEVEFAPLWHVVAWVSCGWAHDLISKIWNQNHTFSHKCTVESNPLPQAISLLSMPRSRTRSWSKGEWQGESTTGTPNGEPTTGNPTFGAKILCSIDIMYDWLSTVWCLRVHLSWTPSVYCLQTYSYYWILVQYKNFSQILLVMSRCYGVEYNCKLNFRHDLFVKKEKTKTENNPQRTLSLLLPLLSVLVGSVRRDCGQSVMDKNDETKFRWAAAAAAAAVVFKCLAHCSCGKCDGSVFERVGRPFEPWSQIVLRELSWQDWCKHVHFTLAWQVWATTGRRKRCRSRCSGGSLVNLIFCLL